MSDRPDHLGNFTTDKNNTFMVGIPLSPSTVYVDHPNDNRLNNYQNDLANRKRNTTSFQITSVTVQGSRTNTEDFEDSLDDFEESHTDDISSDILDSSKLTEPDGYHSEDNTNVDDLSPCGPLIITPLTPVTSESTRINVGLNINMTSSFPTIGSNMVNSGVTMITNNIESPVSAQVPMMPDNWQHRFKVVKIVSTEPFKRGRWVCMDFRDPPTNESNNNRCSIPSIHITPSSFDSNKESHEQLNVANTVAHVVEIPVSNARPIEIPVQNPPMQQYYGIFIPPSNPENVENQATLVENIPFVPGTNEIFYDSVSQVRSHSHPILFQANQASFTPGSSLINMPFAPSVDTLNGNAANVNGYGVIPNPVSMDQKNNNNAYVDVEQATNKVNSSAPVAVSEKSTRSNSSVEDLESRFCSLANQLSRTSGLSQSPPVVQLNTTSNDEYLSRPRTPSQAITYTAPSTVCATPPPTTAPVTVLPSTELLVNSAASSGSNTVAIDNKIEQAMDLVKSHLMFAVREEVEVLKEKITELLERISQLEHENDILRANASPETLKQLNQSQKKFTEQQTGPPHIQNQPPPP